MYDLLNGYFWTSYIVWTLVFIAWATYLTIWIKRKDVPISIFLLLFPVLTFLSFTYVFILNNGENTAQFAAGNDSAERMWDLWFKLFLPLLIGNLVCGVVALFSLIWPPYPPRHWKPLIRRVLILLTVALSFYYVMAFAPDA